MNLCARKSFTLIEIMVVVVILSVIAGLGIPNYLKSQERSHADDAMNQLKAIHAANHLYHSRTGEFWPEGTNPTTLAEINAALALNIIPNGMTYACVGDGTGVTFSCTAVREGGSFTLTVTDVPLSETSGSENPSCAGCL